jgi:hypothetical protein
MSISFVSRGAPVCINCGAPAQERHHVVPDSLGGRATVYLCSACHGLAHGMHRADIRELTRQGLQRARSEGRKLGRPQALTPDQQQQVLQALADGQTVYSLAKTLGVARQVIMRVRDAAQSIA